MAQLEAEIAQLKTELDNYIKGKNNLNKIMGKMGKNG